MAEYIRHFVLYIVGEERGIKKNYKNIGLDVFLGFQKYVMHFVVISQVMRREGKKEADLSRSFSLRV